MKYPRLGWLLWLAFAGVTGSAAAQENLPQPLTDSDFRQYAPAQAKLGRLLFYDRVLSGTFRVSCATCHNHDRASSNGFPIVELPDTAPDDLAINGLPLYDPLRPSSRHAPPLFNLGAKEFVAMFSDGRVAETGKGIFISPSKDPLPDGLSDVLAVQSLFPAVTGDELVGTVESDLSIAAHNGDAAVWAALAERVRDLPEYLPHFRAAYPQVTSSSQITVTRIANAIAAFVGTEWRSDQSPFDRYLRGDQSALSAAQLRGMKWFYGDAGCAQCHSGPLMSDNDYHSIGAWPWRFDADFNDDLPKVLPGRINVTGKASDAFKMRTPSLRNVAFSAPYGYAGGYETLKEVIEAHVDPEKVHNAKVALIEKQQQRWSADDRKIAQSVFQSRSIAVSPLKGLAAEGKLDPVIDDLIAFLSATSDEAGARGRLGKPEEVPSSLVLD